MENWQHLHGASVHFPIAMLLTSVAFDLGATLFKKESWRTVGFWMLLVGTALSVPAILSGLTGANGWLGYEPAWTESKLLPRHRNLALIGGSLSLALLLWRVFTKDRLRGGAWWAYLFVALAMVGAIGYAGYLGGEVKFGN
jgi:uncharacterized membrane protein